MLSLISIQNNTKSEELLTPITALPPLPVEMFPRVLGLRKRKWDYYITLVVISLIRLITPLSAYVRPTIALTIRIYLIIFPVIVPRLRGAARIIACLLAFYALVEVIFAGYYAYLVRQVQSRPVGAKVPDDSRDAMVHRILGMDLSSSRTGNTPARGIDRNHTFTMTDLGSDTTLAEEVGRADGMGEKSEKTTSLSVSSQRATGKTEQRAPLSNESAVEFRERLRTW
jgi:hypothetical protein